MGLKLTKSRLTLGASALAVAAALSLGAPTAAWAQTSESTLRGTAPAGVTVVARDVNTGAVRKTTANADGTYVLSGLQPGSYHVTAGDKLAGDVDLSVASISVFNFGSGSGTTVGELVVTGAKRQTVEVHTSQVNQIISLHDINALPQATRNFMEFADTVPGVTFTSEGSSHNTSLRGGAQLDSAVNLYIDGVDQKDYVQGGSGIAGTAGATGNGDPGNPFPQLAIGEYKVVTSNYSAEYGDASSAIIIAQTKSGTNQFHGEVFGDYTNQNLRDEMPDEYGVGKTVGADKEYGLSFSGPIIQDKLHFFVTWEHKSLSDTADVYPGNSDGITLAEAKALLPPSVASQYGPTTNPFTENLAFGKIDFEPSSSDRIELSGTLRKEDSIQGGSGQSAELTAADNVNNVYRGDLHWQHSGNGWVNEARISYQKTSSSTSTAASAPQSDYVYYPTGSPSDPTDGLINVGGPGDGVGGTNGQKGFTFADNFTYSNFHFKGDHTLKFGVSYGGIKLTTSNGSSSLNDATYYYAVTPSGVSTVPYEVQFPDLTKGVSSASVTTTDKQYSAFAQDDWNVNRHLTINLGVRMDHEVVPSYLNYVTPSAIVNGINGPYCIPTADCSAAQIAANQTYAAVVAMGTPATSSTLAIPGYNIANYISTGHNRSAPYNFSPRIGFSYDLNGDSKHVIFGGYGRSYNRNQFATLSLETTKVALNTNPQVYFPTPETNDSFDAGVVDANGNTGCHVAIDINPNDHCYAWNPNYLTAAGLASLVTSPTSGEVDMLNNNLKTPYSDQFSLGIRNKIGEWNTQATLSYVESYDNIVGHLGNRYANGAYFENGAPWNGSEGVPGTGGNLVLWDNGTGDQDFQVALAAQKPYTKESGWSMGVSYTYSDAHQNNVAGGPGSYNVSPNSYLFDYPYPWDYKNLPSTAVPKHRLVVTYTHDVPWGIQVAAKLSLSTPQPEAQINGCPNGTYCNPYGGGAYQQAYAAPGGLVGYKDIDLAITKNFTIPYRDVTAYVRLDILNIFNWVNYDPSDDQLSQTSTGRYVSSYQNDGPIVGTPLTVKLSVGAKF